MDVPLEYLHEVCRYGRRITGNFSSTLLYCLYCGFVSNRSRRKFAEHVPARELYRWVCVCVYTCNRVKLLRFHLYTYVTVFFLGETTPRGAISHDVLVVCNFFLLLPPPPPTIPLSLVLGTSPCILRTTTGKRQTKQVKKKEKDFTPARLTSLRSKRSIIFTNHIYTYTLRVCYCRVPVNTDCRTMPYLELFSWSDVLYYTTRIIQTRVPVEFRVGFF